MCACCRCCYLCCLYPKRVLSHNMCVYIYICSIQHPGHASLKAYTCGPKLYKVLIDQIGPCSIAQDSRQLGRHHGELHRGTSRDRRLPAGRVLVFWGVFRFLAFPTHRPVRLDPARVRGVGCLSSALGLPFCSVELFFSLLDIYISTYLYIHICNLVYNNTKLCSGFVLPGPAGPRIVGLRWCAIWVSN